MKKIPLIEKFGPTIQGEGHTIGIQTFFLRFGLCDYKCLMCDSMHAVDPIRVKETAQWLTQEEIVDLFPADIKGPNWITLSGGNPCIHDLGIVVNNLKHKGYYIAVETQGTFCPQWLTDCDIVTVSPKAPGMGEVYEADKYATFCESLKRQPGFNCKIVVFTEEDLAFAEARAKEWQMKQGSLTHFYLSQGNPFPPGKEPGYLGMNVHISTLRREYLILFDKIQKYPHLTRVKFLPQFHVWLWANKQGV